MQADLSRITVYWESVYSPHQENKGGKKGKHVLLNLSNGIFNPRRDQLQDRVHLAAFHERHCQNGKLISAGVLHFPYINCAEWLTFREGIEMSVLFSLLQCRSVQISLTSMVYAQSSLLLETPPLPPIQIRYSSVFSYDTLHFDC